MKCFKKALVSLHFGVLVLTFLAVTVGITILFVPIPITVSQYRSSLKERNAVGPPFLNSSCTNETCPRGSCLVAGWVIRSGSCCLLVQGKCGNGPCFLAYTNLTYLDHQGVRRYTQPILGEWPYTDDRNRESTLKDLQEHLKTRGSLGRPVGCWVGHEDPTRVDYDDHVAENEKWESHMWNTVGVLVGCIVLTVVLLPVLVLIEYFGVGFWPDLAAEKYRKKGGSPPVLGATTLRSDEEVAIEVLKEPEPLPDQVEAQEGSNEREKGETTQV